MSGRVLTLKEFGLEIGFRAEKIVEVQALPIAISKRHDEKAKYEFDVLMQGANYLLEHHVKPLLIEKLNEKLFDTGVTFSSMVIIEDEVKSILAEINSSGDTEKYKDVALVIYKKPELIKSEYGLISKYDFAKSITKDEEIHMQSSLNRITSVINEHEVKHVAYSNKLAPLYKVADLESYYSQWLEEHKARLKTKSA